MKPRMDFAFQPGSNDGKSSKYLVSLEGYPILYRFVIGKKDDDSDNDKNHEEGNSGL